LYHVLLGLPEASGGDQQHNYETHNYSPLWFSSCSCCTVIPRGVIFALRLWYIIGASVSIEARLYTIPSQFNMSAVTAFTLPDARAIQQDATRSVITILMLVSDHPMPNRPDAGLS
jgi:hypothetical protein